MKPRCALVMAGGTGGHIFPGLAVAEALRQAGWKVHWLGAPGSMEAELVPPRGFAFEPVQFGGVRGKGLMTLALLPLRLLRAFWQSLQVVRRVQPDVVLGLGGYITFPGGMMGVLLGKPLVLHERGARRIAKIHALVGAGFDEAVGQGDGSEPQRLEGAGEGAGRRLRVRVHDGSIMAPPAVARQAKCVKKYPRNC